MLHGDVVSLRHRAGWLGLGWAACLGESMLQPTRVGWRLLACLNGASPDCILVVLVCVVVCCCVLLCVAIFQAQRLWRQALRMKLSWSRRWQITLRHRGLRKMALRRPGGARKMRQKRRNPIPPPSDIFKCKLHREVRVHRHDENM